MKATKLVEALQDAIRKHGDLEVCTEGCDCEGDVDGVELTESWVQEGQPPAQYLLIRRPAGG